MGELLQPRAGQPCLQRGRSPRDPAASPVALSQAQGEVREICALRLKAVQDIRKPDYGGILLGRARKIGPNAVAWAEGALEAAGSPLISLPGDERAEPVALFDLVPVGDEAVQAEHPGRGP